MCRYELTPFEASNAVMSSTGDKQHQDARAVL